MSQPFLVQHAINYVSSPDTQRNTSIGYGLVAAYGLVYINVAVRLFTYVSDSLTILS
jgi:ATP-binding cassette subfamily C (CFTR/MRP) protein 1